MVDEPAGDRPRDRSAPGDEPRTPATAADLAEAIEALLVGGPAESRFLRYLDVPGVTASMGPGPEPAENRVGCSDLDADMADETVRLLGARYGAAGRGARWFVTLRTRPSDLAEGLARAGWQRNEHADLLGMAIPLDHDGVPGPERDEDEPHVVASSVEDRVVRRVGIGDLRRHVDVLASGFGTSTQEWLGTLDMLSAGALPGCRFEHYLAYEGGVPIGFGSSLVDDTRRVTLLGGSAVVREARGRGHYRALVRARLDDARADGSVAAVVQANPATSAPILQRLGFTLVVAISAYDLPRADAPAGRW